MKFKRNALTLAVIVATSTLTACGGSSSTDTSPVEVNTAPTAISLSAHSVDENTTSADGIEIGTLTATDANSDDTFTYSVTDERFKVEGDKLILVQALDFEAEETVEVTVTDSGSLSYSETLSLTVSDLADYDFKSKVTEGAKSVSYGGQITRHALIAELKHYIGKGGLQAHLDDGTLTTKEDVIAKLNEIYNRGGDDDAERETSWDGFAITFTDAKQKLFSDIGSCKSLKDKVAGNDASGQHKLWNGDENGDNIAFAGWGEQGNITPSGLIQHFFSQLADNAMENLGGERYIPGTDTAIDVYVNYDGTDLNQLIQKFLLMSVAYSQAADDYLDENKGLAADNVTGDKGGTKPYSKLEHQFDEGFGYFGAARNYLSYNDKEIAGKVKVEGEGGRLDWNGKHDTNGDGEIDLLSEINFGNSVNAAKRVLGSAKLEDGIDNSDATDYTKAAMEAFLAGRKLINDNVGADLSPEQKEELVGYRDTALDAWERSVVATVIHYINDLRADLEPLENGEEGFDFVKAAKHFSEMKGFALGLQFNPYSPIAGEDAEKFSKFVELHRLLKDAPVLNAADVEDYRADLLSARNLLQQAYSFNENNVKNW